MLNFYSRAKGKKIPFLPIDKNKVTMYVCGPTVYDKIHLGNAQSAIVFDVIYRILCALFPKVIYVRNITDVDDKINAAAKQQNISIYKLTEKTTASFHQVMERLHVLPPTYEPRATDYIEKMISMIKLLIDKNAAYYSDGHVLFSVDRFHSYGELSNMSKDQMKIGARVDIADYKENPVDFVLWKPSEPSEIGWESPWGRGRPGWHIECSAMSNHFFGSVFDIHGGGNDLLFPHHENERAQSCSLSGENDCARYWLHNGMLLINGQKMSKSLQNFITAEQALEKIPADVIRWAMLSSHYRHSLDWTKALLFQSQNCVNRIYKALEIAGDVDGEKKDIDEKFMAALCDDVNTPEALMILQHMANALFKNPSDILLAKKLKGSANLLGLVQMTCQAWAQPMDDLSLSEKEIQNFIKQRHEARNRKDYTRADEIRSFLLTRNIVLEDVGPETTTWRVFI